MNDINKMHKFAKRFGLWVLAYRKSLRWTQQKLADEAKITKQYISMVERAKPQAGGNPAVVSREKVAAIAKALKRTDEEGWRIAGYGGSLAEAESYEMLNGVELIFRPLLQMSKNKKRRLIDGCRLIAKSVALSVV